MLIECSFCECITSIENVDPNAEYECNSCGKPLDVENMQVESEDQEDTEIEYDDRPDHYPDSGYSQTEDDYSDIENISDTVNGYLFGGCLDREFPTWNRSMNYPT